MTINEPQRPLGDEYPSVNILVPTLSYIENNRCSVWKSCVGGAGGIQPAAAAGAAVGGFGGPAGAALGWAGVTLAGCGSGMFYSLMHKWTGACDDSANG